MASSYTHLTHVSSNIVVMSDVRFDLWLKEQLRRREWSESDLARKMEMRPSVVNRWVRGERVPSSESAEKIADVLGTDTDWVLTLTGHRPKELAVRNESLEDARMIPETEHAPSKWSASVAGLACGYKGVNDGGGVSPADCLLRRCLSFRLSPPTSVHLSGDRSIPNPRDACHVSIRDQTPRDGHFSRGTRVIPRLLEWRHVSSVQLRPCAQSA